MNDWMQEQQINRQEQQINQQEQQINQQPQQINQQPQQMNQQPQQQINRQGQQQMQQINEQAGIPAVQAQTVAGGRAVQQVVPAKKSYKARREEKRHAAEARKYCPVGNAVTYDIKHQLEDYHIRRKTLFDRNFPVIGFDTETNTEKRDMSKNKSGVDRRVLQCFTHGFRLDKEGRPTTADDLKYQLEDEAFYDAFCSTEYTRRVPYLQQMVEEVLNLDLKEDMFSDNSLRRDAAHFKSVADRIVYMENVMKDKNNAFFFDSPLCPVKKEVLKKALDIAGPMVPAFMTACQKRGVEPDDEIVRYVSTQTGIDAYSATAEYHDAAYKGAPGRYQSLQAAPAEEKEQQMTREIYQQYCSLLEGDVKRLLDCNVEELCALSEKEIRGRKEELLKLYSASLNADKWMALRHPVYKGRTMKDELIGQRGLEYEYKSTVLKGLAERAAGFQRQGKQTIKDAAARYENRMKPGTPEFVDFFESFSRLDLNARVASIPPKFAAVTNKFEAIPAEEREKKNEEAGEIAQKIKELQAEEKKLQAEGKNEKVGEIAEKIKELQAEEKKLQDEGKIAGVMERLQNRAYYTLEYSKEQLKDMNLPSDTTETLFRSFDGFLTSEAAQTLLTPEEFEQMLFNLGAGAGLTYESDKKQRDEAIKMNNAGLDTLRKVLTAQYDMLERKYGDSLERLTFQELMEHYEDIGKDLTTGQQDLHLTEFPGFIREGNLEDERLANRILYYRMCSQAIADVPNFILAGLMPEDPSGVNLLEISDESFQKHIQNTVIWTQEGAAAKEYLMKNSGFRHPLDRSQKVKNPAGGN